MIEVFLYFLYSTCAVAIALLVILKVRSKGRFSYRKTKNYHTSIHLSPLRTPLNASGAGCLVGSIRKILRHLKKEGYQTVEMESHLLNPTSILALQKLLNREGMMIDDSTIKTKPTPLVHIFIIKTSKLLLQFSRVKVNPLSTKVTVLLKP